MARVKLTSTPATLVLMGLIWLSSASSAEAAPIVFPDDSCHEPQQINWVLSPAGIGAIVIRLDLVSTGDCEEIDSNSEGAGTSGGGGFGGGGGGIVGGSPGGQSSGPSTPPNGAFAGEDQFELTDPPDLEDLPSSFTGDLPPFGDGNDPPGGGGNDSPGIIGGSLSLLLETYPLLSDDEFGPGDRAMKGSTTRVLLLCRSPDRSCCSARAWRWPSAAYAAAEICFSLPFDIVKVCPCCVSIRSAAMSTHLGP